jgi:hypothetical protein
VQEKLECRYFDRLHERANLGEKRLAVKAAEDNSWRDAEVVSGKRI